MINRSYLEKFGFTPECAKCNAIRAGDETQPGLAHSQDCRKRIEECMELDPFLKGRVGNAEQRRDDYLARRIEASDSKSKRTRIGGVTEIELESGPARASEEIVPEAGVEDGEPIGDADMEAVRGEGGNPPVIPRRVRPRAVSPAPSTVTCESDIPDLVEDVEDDVPLPVVEPASSSSGPSSGQKRRAEKAGDEARGDPQEDPLDAQDDMAGTIESGIHFFTQLVSLGHLPSSFSFSFHFVPL